MIWFYPDQFKSRVWDRSNLLSRQIDLLDCEKTLEANVLHDSHGIFEASSF